MLGQQGFMIRFAPSVHAEVPRTRPRSLPDDNRPARSPITFDRMDDLAVGADGVVEVDSRPVAGADDRASLREALGFPEKSDDALRSRRARRRLAQAPVEA